MTYWGTPVGELELNVDGMETRVFLADKVNVGALCSECRLLFMSWECILFLLLG